ncbi:MAG: SBBP repeat-containing protein [Planctomycetota bacterium]
MPSFFPTVLAVAATTLAITPIASGRYQASWSYTLDFAGFGDSLEDMAVDADGSVVFTGQSATAFGVFTEDLVTVKLDADGNPLWSTRYDGPAGRADRGLGVALGADGSVYVTGQSDGGPSGLDIVTIRYSRDGVRQWVARYSDPNDSLDRGTDIAVDANGRAFVTGYSLTATGYHYTTLAYDAAGNQRWVAQHVSPDGVARAIALDRAGNPIVTGSDGGRFGTVKYDAGTGEQLWVARYSAASLAEAFDLAVDDDDNVYVTGSSGTGYAGTLVDWATIKYDAAGQRQWLRRYDGPAGSIDEPVALALDPSQTRLVVTGYSEGLGTSSDLTTISYDAATGDRQWTARLNGPENGLDRAEDVVVDASGQAAVVGTWVVARGAVREQIALSYDDNGVETWRATTGAPGSRSAHGRMLRLGGRGASLYTGGLVDNDYGVQRFDAAGAYEAFGAGCAGTIGTPVLSASTTPALGTPLDLVVAPAAPSRPSFGIVGASRTSLGAVSLPVALGPAGAPGCTLFVSLDVVVPLPPAPGGPATPWRLLIPGDPALLCQQLFLQVVVPDDVNPLGVITSNAGQITVGVSP